MGPQVEEYIIKQAKDFRKLKKLDPTQGPFGEQLKIAGMLQDALKGSVPFVQTTFSPLSVAGRMAGAKNRDPAEAEPIKRFMKEDPESLQYGLKTISQTLVDYTREAIRSGADGMFLTTTVYSKDTITEDEYEIFGKPFDIAIFNAANEAGATFNILHICRENIMLDLLSDYPVQVINYEATSPRNPSLKEAMEKTDKALWGGLDHNETLPNGPVEAIVSQVNDALKQTGGRRFILGPGCTGLLRAPDAHLTAAKEALSTC
jgi:uroporphyrinogen decarboxylase